MRLFFFSKWYLTKMFFVVSFEYDIISYTFDWEAKDSFRKISDIQGPFWLNQNPLNMDKQILDQCNKTDLPM